MLLSLTMLLSTLAFASGDSPQRPAPIWARTYHPGETLRYHMDGTNQGERYSVAADVRVERTDAGLPVEHFAWSELRVEGRPVELNAASAAFRQSVSLAPDYINSVPPLGGLESYLIGPVTDLTNFYSDLWLAGKLSAGLTKPGDHVAFPFGQPASWADGTMVTLGEDSIDFDVTLVALDAREKTAILVVRHVAPIRPAIRIPVDWMRMPVASAANNWVEVRTLRDGTFQAEVGNETFDDRITVDTSDGKIITAQLNNPVEAIRRVCTDAALQHCAAPAPLRILRTVSFELART
jgi:hypothetical protein